MGVSSRNIARVEDPEFLLAVPTWDHRNDTRRCSGCYNARQFLQIAVDGNSS